MCKFRQTRIVGLLLAVLCMWATASGVQPKVIKTVPENGDEDVDQRLREIIIAFDQDMTVGQSYSICGGGQNFPQIVGNPQWRGRRTLVMRVNLLANHEYEFSVNCPSFGNCRNVQGEPAVPYPVRFKTGAAKKRADVKGDMRADNERAVKELRRLIDEEYSYRDLRKVDWDKTFEEQTAVLLDANTPQEFARIAGKLLAAARDKHIWLTVGQQQFASYVKPVTPNANAAKLAAVVPNLTKRSDVVYAGRLDDRIGYIRIDSWDSRHTEALERCYDAIQEFSGASGLVIDVRFNGGGSEPLAQEFAGCFLNEPVVYAQHVYRDVGRPDGFTDPQNRVLNPSKNRPKYRGKVAVLMGPANMSSCESFLLMMKKVTNCKLVGAKSQGSSGNPKPHDLGNEVTIFLPSWKDLRPDGTCLETEGIQPDIPVEIGQQDAGDKVLEQALNYLRQK